MIAKILILVGFLFLLVTVGPWVIDLINSLGEAGNNVKEIIPT